MQDEIAERLRKNWGDKPCDHPKFEKEYFLGMHGDYVCCQCGRVFTKEERDEAETKRRVD
jgi:hypothetical protein